ncbi:hypothetical protein Hanom_Chr02g00141141 [Helianthus anomalus]
MGFRVFGTMRYIAKSGFIQLWQFLVTKLRICFSKKTVNFNEISYRFIEPLHAIVHNVPYNFPHYLVVTSHLDFGGVPIWYPRAEMVFQENFHNV